MLKVAKADLKRSGITEVEAQAAEMFSTTDASEYHEDFRPVPAIIIPYVDPWTDAYVQYENGAGKMHDFFRVRYLDEQKSHGFKKKKAIRYSQPKNSGIHAYFPITEQINWEEVLSDPEMAVVITEGEKKALAACLDDIPTIGLGGVFNFASDGTFLDVLDKAEWSGREVYICYDSDAITNPKIAMAEARLAAELSLERGAIVRLVRLPEGKDGAKVGLDDYLVEHGPDKFISLMEKAPNMRPVDKEVLRLNTDVAWIEDEGIIIDIDTNVVIKKDNFTAGSKYSTRTVISVDAKGGVKVVPVAKVWLTHPHAQRYSSITFRPDTEERAVSVPGGGVAFNRFRGLSGTEGDVAPFFKLVDFLVSETPEIDTDFIFNLVCWKMQNLGERAKLGIMMVGEQGAGKTLFTDIIGKMVVPYNVEISSAELGSDFNPWIESALIVTMNEAKATNLKFNIGVLNGYITDETKGCNEKYRARKQVINYGFYMFNANQRSAGAFSGDDRRMVVMKTPKKHKEKRGFYGPIFDWYENGGPGHLLHYMQNYDLEGWQPPIEAPETREKRMSYLQAMSPIEKVAYRIQTATVSVVYQWIKSAMDWANSVTSGGVASSAKTMIAAETILANLPNMTVRPFYTPEELLRMFAPMMEEYTAGSQKPLTSGFLAQCLIQEGIPYLMCEENFDGFQRHGYIHQYLIIADRDEYKLPISQDEFDDLMEYEFPTFSEMRKELAVKSKKARRKSKRNKRV